METLLEQQRRIHEERERLEKAMVDEILHKKQSVSLVEIFLRFCDSMASQLLGARVLIFFDATVSSLFNGKCSNRKIHNRKGQL